MRRTEHIVDKTDIELNNWEFQLVMGEVWENRHIFINNFFCDCKTQDRELIAYKVYLTKLNDLILRGKCSGCNTIAARYIETGEDPNNAEAAIRIRKIRKDSR